LHFIIPHYCQSCLLNLLILIAFGSSLRADLPDYGRPNQGRESSPRSKGNKRKTASAFRNVITRTQDVARATPSAATPSASRNLSTTTLGRVQAASSAVTPLPSKELGRGTLAAGQTLSLFPSPQSPTPHAQGTANLPIRHAGLRGNLLRQAGAAPSRPQTPVYSIAPRRTPLTPVQFANLVAESAPVNANKGLRKARKFSHRRIMHLVYRLHNQYCLEQQHNALRYTNLKLRTFIAQRTSESWKPAPTQKKTGPEPSSTFRRPPGRPAKRPSGKDAARKGTLRSQTAS
jgi:hypothetical protein